MKRTRVAHSQLAPAPNRATGDWVKSNQTAKGISISDGRGKYLHSKG